MEIDYAWAAGFYEGEGSFYTNTTSSASGRPRASRVLSLVQVDKEPLEKFAKIFPGGKFYFRKRTGNASDIWTLVYHSERAVEVMDCMWTYLSNRRREQYNKYLQVFVDVDRLRQETPHKERALKEECKRGHAFSVENTYIPPDGRRVCKACRALTDERRRQKNVSRLAH